MTFFIPVRFCPLIPPAPFSHKGRRGRILGVLMPETEDDTQGLPKKPTPSKKKRRAGEITCTTPFNRPPMIRQPVPLP